MSLSSALSHLENSRVLITGNTGFKGSWLSLWLHEFGAEVEGFSDTAEARSMFALCGLREIVPTSFGDIRSKEVFFEAADAFEPEVIFHLAAQPIVRESIRDPLTTFATNGMGTANVLEYARLSRSEPNVVLVTSDKVYENHGWPWGYRETDELSRQDPYSTSKAIAEMIAASFISTYPDSGLSNRIAIGRAGNVIGGGDFATDRLIPDVFRSIKEGKELLIRNPDSTRPWQHALEPLSGYILLAGLLADGNNASVRGQAFNFGPNSTEVASVSDVLTGLQKYLPFSWAVDPSADQEHAEAKLLSLDCSKAAQRLSWRPTLSLDSTLDWTTEWYRHWLELAEDSTALREIALRQIHDFMLRQA